jgi:predicted deacetylase
MRQLIISIHDVHPSSFEACRQQVIFCESIGIRRFSILAVPAFHVHEPLDRSVELVKWLQAREALGDEVVIHGFYHLNISGITSAASWFWNRLYTANEAEFVHLGFKDARKRIEKGRQCLLDAGLHPVGFVAPGWLMNSDVVKAVFSLGLSYTNSLTAIIPAAGGPVRRRSLCYSARAAWRRHSSLLWNGRLWRITKNTDLVRISLHPGDLEHAALQAQISAVLTNAIDLGYQSTTYRDFVISHT